MSFSPPHFITALEAGRFQKVVFYGTSLTHLGTWVRHLRLALQKRYGSLIEIRNAAQSARHSAWGLANLSEQVLRHQPDAVWIEFAINDAYQPYATNVTQARQNLELMCEQIWAAHPECEIILLTMNVPVGEHAAQRPDLASYYQMYREVAVAHGLALVDLAPHWERLRDEARTQFDRYVPDGIHPGVLGCEEVITPRMLEFLFPSGG